MPFAQQKKNTTLGMASPEAMDAQISGQLQSLARGASSYEEGRRAVSPDRNQIQRAPVQMERDGSEPAYEAVQEVNLDAAAMSGGADAEQDGQQSGRSHLGVEDTKRKGARDDDAVERAGAAATVMCDNTSGIYGAATIADSLKTAQARDNPANEALNEGVSQTTKDLSMWAAGAGVAFDVVGLVMSIIAVDDKNTKNRAFRHHMRGGRLTKQSKKSPETAADVSRYAFEKSSRAVFDAWYKVIVTAMNLAGNVLTLIGAAAGGIGATLGVVLKALAGIGKAVRAAWRGGKALWKMFKRTRGKNRQMNSEKLMELAMNGDEEACEILLEMDIGMLTGSVEHSVRRSKMMRRIGAGHKERLSDSSGKKLDKKTATPADVTDVLRTLHARLSSSDPDVAAAAEGQWLGLRAELMQGMRSVI